MLSNLLALLGPIGKYFTGIDVNTLLTAVFNELQAVAASVVKYWQYYLIAVLVAGNLLSYAEWQRNVSSLSIEVAAHAADIKAYKQAQADALAKAVAEKQILIDSSKAKANAADENYSTLYSKYQSSLLRYKASGSTSSGPTLGEHSDPAQSPDGPGKDSQIPDQVTISMDDADICAVNTARLQAAHEWALKLKEHLHED
jgi:hypothetical protein